MPRRCTPAPTHDHPGHICPQTPWPFWKTGMRTEAEFRTAGMQAPIAALSLPPPKLKNFQGGFRMVFQRAEEGRQTAVPIAKSAPVHVTPDTTSPGCLPDHSDITQLPYGAPRPQPRTSPPYSHAPATSPCCHRAKRCKPSCTSPLRLPARNCTKQCRAMKPHSYEPDAPADALALLNFSWSNWPLAH